MPENPSATTAPLPTSPGQMGDVARDTVAEYGTHGPAGDAIKNANDAFNRLNQVENGIETVENLRQRERDANAGRDTVDSMLRNLENMNRNMDDLIENIPIDFPGKDALANTVGQIFGGLADRFARARERYNQYKNQPEGGQPGGGNPGGDPGSPG